jgi:hypothetical protein
MKYLFLLLLGFFFYQDSFSQRLDFKISFHHENTFIPKIDTIDYQSFEKIKAIGFQSVPLSATPGQNIDSLVEAIDYTIRQNEIRMDSVVKVLKHKYSAALQQKDSCLTLNGIDNQILICNNRNQNDNQAWSSYKFSDYQKGYIVVEHDGYEQWEYVLFNPKTRIYKSAHYSPVFVNDSIIYTSGNYYSEGGFQYMQLTSNLYFGFESYDWELRECYRVKNVFYFYFKSNRHDKECYKYLKIDFEKVF